MKRSQAERRVVRAAMDVYSHPEFDEKTGWVLGSKRVGIDRAIAINAKLWKACAALRASRKKR